MECEKVAQLHSNNLIVLASSNCFEFITAFILNYDRINSTKKERKKKKTVQATTFKLTASDHAPQKFHISNTCLLKTPIFFLDEIPGCIKFDNQARFCLDCIAEQHFRSYFRLQTAFGN